MLNNKFKPKNVNEELRFYKELCKHLAGCMCDASYLRQDQVESYLKAKEMMN